MKSTDIILVNPPVNLPKFMLGVGKGEPLGMCYLASNLRNNGYNVNIIDANIQDLTLREIIKIITHKNPNLIGISCFTSNIISCIELARSVKKEIPTVHICVGGHLATAAHIDLLRDFQVIDSVVRGEGEETFLELADVLTHTRNESKKIEKMRKIRGLTFRSKGRNNKIYVNPPRPLNPNLDIYPFPARDFAKMIYSQGFNVNISTSRGCYGGCIYCSIFHFYTPGPKWRGRTPQNVIEEISELYHQYNFRHFFFVDDNFIGPSRKSGERAMLIAKMILDEGMDIEFLTYFRPNDCYKVNLNLLRKSGLTSVFIGVESFYEPTLKKFKRHLSVKDNIRAINILKENNIHPILGFIFFHPWLTIEEINENLKFLELFIDYWDYNSWWNTLGIHFGTELWKEMKKESNCIESHHRFGKYIPKYRFYDKGIEKIANAVYRYAKKINWVDTYIENILRKNSLKNSGVFNKTLFVFRREIRQNHLRFIKEITRSVEANEERSIDNILDKYVMNVYNIKDKFKEVWDL